MSSSIHFTAFLSRACAAVVMLFLFGCGGGGGATSSSFSGGIGGTGVKGPVGGASITAYAITNGAKGAPIATGPTDGNGNFNLSIGGYAGPVMLQLSGGTYTDEATGTTMPMASGDVMTAVLTSVAAGATISGVQMTPLTSMAQTRALAMSGGMTDTNIAAANAAVGNYFIVSDILHTPPINPLVQGSGTAAGVSQDMKNYGMALAAISQYAQSINMAVSSALVTAMMSDASDGFMDGKMGANQISMAMGGMMGMGNMAATAGTSGLATAMTSFITNLTANRSGLTTINMNALIQKLTISNGQI